ncbi:MAG: 23S rRNA (uracil(1939)-C(5))-methyltransferase RlmD [Clostridiales bacterium]|nr:23S rRNA (uracil(1939)-C(5))-methyltransferase RlmD [Clostridiales bacterium]
MLKKNDVIELEISGLTSLGSGAGRFGGFVIFVAKSAPGDKILCRIIKSNKSYAVGIIEKIITPSPARVAPGCPAFKSCGGCAFRHIDYDEELRQKLLWVNSDLKKIAHVDYRANKIVGAVNTERYRNKAQYPAAVNGGRLITGFFAYKSHRIIECTDCRLHPKEFEAAIGAFAQWVQKSQITGYDEKTGIGLLRHIYLRKAFGTGEIMAVAVINGNDIPERQLLIDLLRRNVPGLKSIQLNINYKNTNTVLGQETRLIWGSEKITDILLGKSFVISAKSFYQVNHDMCEKLYEKVGELAALGGGETVVDLYCGAGTIGLTLAGSCKKLIGIEIAPSAIENAKENARINSADNAEFICADAFTGACLMNSRGESADLVIVDPPRKGCQSELFDVIEQLGARRIIYVSCNSATLARDIGLLIKKGYYPADITAFDLFPRTANVECVALLAKE